MKTLHLVLKHKWYDMIASGEKLEEYRACEEYWIKRLFGGATRCVFAPARQSVRQKLPVMKWKTVTFHRGYTSTTMTFEIESVWYGHGLPQWGAPAEKCFILKFRKGGNYEN